MSTKERSLDGQVALVTGGSRGIGRAIAIELGRRGAHVGVNYRRGADAARTTLDAIEAAGGAGQLVPFDVGDAAAVPAAVSGLAKEHGRLDILVNNAGINIDGLLLRYRDEDWTRTMDVNLGGAFRCARAAARFMARKRYGRIVNVSSVVAQLGNAGQVAYASTKAGLEGLTRVLARELASRAITVNAVAPGFVDTEMTAALGEDARAAYLTMIPLARLGTTAEVASAVAFLASPEASYVTGHVLAVNGGLYT